MDISFTPLTRALVAMTVLLFVHAFLFENLLVAVAGAGMMFYLAYRRMEFSSQLRRAAFKAERKVLEEFVHKGSPISVKLEISSSETIGVRARDSIPDGFRPEGAENVLRGTVRPGAPIHSISTILPREKGMKKFPPVKVVLTEARGLFTSETMMDPATEVLVRASKKEMALAELLARRKRFEIKGPAHRRHTRTIRADFRTIRDYAPGDRFRDIDWKASSRLTRLMTREFEQETHLPTVIVIDASLSMRERIDGASKLEHAASLAMQTARVMGRQGHPLGLIAHDENKVLMRISPGSVDEDEVLSSILKLPTPSPPHVTSVKQKDLVRPATTPADERFLSLVGPFMVRSRRKGLSRDRVTGIFESLRHLEGKEETGLLLVIFTDLETNWPSFLKAMRHAISKQHRIVVVPMFPPARMLNGGEPTEKWLEEAYLLHENRQSMVGNLRRMGVKVIEIGWREGGEKVISGLRRMSQ